MAGVPSGLRPASDGVVRRENAQTESNTCRLLAEMTSFEVRKNPKESAQTRGSRRKKNQLREVGFLTIGGGGGNRTRVQRSSTDSSTYLVLSFEFYLADADTHAATRRVT